MSIREVPLVTEHFYHVFNRGVAKQPIFQRKRDQAQLLLALEYYHYDHPPLKLSHYKALSVDERSNYLSQLRSEGHALIDVVGFCFMPNHFHLLLRQCRDGGITTAVGNMTNSYTRYYNTAHERVGPLFQGRFQAVQIEDNEQLIHVSRYIHLNPFVSGVTSEEELLGYPWSSLSTYVGTTNSFHFLCPRLVLEHFRSQDEYRDFVFDYASYAKDIELIKHLVIE